MPRRLPCEPRRERAEVLPTALVHLNIRQVLHDSLFVPFLLVVISSSDMAGSTYAPLRDAQATACASETWIADDAAHHPSWRSQPTTAHVCPLQVICDPVFRGDSHLDKTMRPKACPFHGKALWPPFDWTTAMLFLILARDRFCCGLAEDHCVVPDLDFLCRLVRIHPSILRLTVSCTIPIQS